MTRKRLVRIIGIFTIIIGLSQFWSFFSPFFDSSKSKVLNPVLIVIGILFFLSGWGLFRLYEFGLELAFWLWLFNLPGSILTIVFLLPPQKSDFTFLVNFLGQPITIFLCILMIVNLLIVIFLGQRETKNIFSREVANNIVSKANVEQELKL